MTDEQKQHILRITETFKTKATAKYEAGVKEHGGNLWDEGALTLVEMAMEEAIDSYVYLSTLRDRIIGDDL